MRPRVPRRGRRLCSNPPSPRPAAPPPPSSRSNSRRNSSSSSRAGSRLTGWRPLIGDTLAGGSLALLGDVVCQLAVEGADEMDWRRCAAMTVSETDST